jgi:hypothetical protein
LAGPSSAGTVTFASSLLKEVYNPKAVIPHAALLDQAFAHCPIFPTAASRRSLGRVSVPVWPVTLSGRLPVVALVSHYLTNKLIGRELIHLRRSFPPPIMRKEVVFGIRRGFPRLFQRDGQIAHVLLTRSPLVYSRRSLTARLACVKHAASVRPEPGSNSPLKISPTQSLKDTGRLNICSTPTNYLLTNKLSELIHRSRDEPKLVDVIDGVFLINLVDFWHTVEFSRIRRTPKPGPFGRPLSGQLV